MAEEGCFLTADNYIPGIADGPNGDWCCALVSKATGVLFYFEKDIVRFKAAGSLLFVQTERKTLHVYSIPKSSRVSVHSFESDIEWLCADECLIAASGEHLFYYYILDDSISPCFKKAYRSTDGMMSALLLSNTKPDALSAGNSGCDAYQADEDNGRRKPVHNTSTNKNCKMGIDKSRGSNDSHNGITKTVDKTALTARHSSGMTAKIEALKLTVIGENGEVSRQIPCNPLFLTFQGALIAVGSRNDVTFYKIGKSKILNYKKIQLAGITGLFCAVGGLLAVALKNASFAIIKETDIVFRDLGRTSVTAFAVLCGLLVVGSSDAFVRVYCAKRFVILCSFRLEDAPVDLTASGSSLFYRTRDGASGEFKTIGESHRVLHAIWRGGDRHGQIGAYDRDCLINEFNPREKYNYDDDTIYEALRNLNE